MKMHEKGVHICVHNVDFDVIQIYNSSPVTSKFITTIPIRSNYTVNHACPLFYPVRNENISVARTAIIAVTAKHDLLSIG